jgi:O-antigen/teichoic acid export membrane protein
VPIYLRYLGIELYGVIGVFWTLQNLLTVLDIGLAQTLNRELAHLSAFPEKAQEMRDLTRTLEIPHWLVAIFLGLLTFLLSPFVAKYWVNAATIPIETITYSFRLMSITFAFQWANSIYLGGFLGCKNRLRIMSSTPFVKRFGQSVQLPF